MTLPNYALEYDEERDAICSLELLAEHLPRVVTVPHQWKWVILSLHNSLQGFMVLSLQGTNTLNVLTKESAKEWSEAYETGHYSSGPPKLDAFMRLYVKIKSDAMKLRGNSKPFTPGTNQDESVRRLNAFRNDFIHYVPAISLLDMRTWAKIVVDVIPIIEFLVFESNNVYLHEPTSRERVSGLCALARTEASVLLSYYGA